tara:strand:+ start:4164 stop:4436 length:273 start_codon:yes stop_codon:yes gene_type:complete
MIIATIGREKFVLKNLEQANQLLSILSNAQQVDEDYLLSESRHILSEANCDVEISISIKQDQDIITKAEGRKQKQKDRERYAESKTSEHA